MCKFYLFIFLQYLCTFVTCNNSITPIAPNIFYYAYNPYWDVRTQSLYFVDYLANGDEIFHRYDYAQNRLYSATLEGGVINPTFVIPLAGCRDELVVSNDKRIVVVRWDGVSPTAVTLRNMTAIEQDPIYASNHLDLAGVDPKGRLVTGTYRTVGCVRTTDVNGTVYVFRKNGEAVPLIHNLDTVAGFAWNKRKKLFYFFDSCTYTIIEYKWSPKTGNIRAPRPVFTFPSTQTYALLGMDISCSGNLFVGLYLAGDVVEVNPKTGTIENIIHMPADTVTGVAFGGPKMETLFVTTAKMINFNYFDVNIPVGIPSNNTSAGLVYMVNGLNTKGCPGKRIKSHL